MVDAITSDKLKKMYANNDSSYRFTLGGLMNTWRRKEAKELFKTLPLKEVAEKIGRSEKQTERILNS